MPQLKRFTRHLAVSIVSAAVLIPSLALATPAQADTWNPPRSASIYNAPQGVGSKAQQATILDTFDHAINATPKGETIRLSTFSVSYKPTIQALIKAKKRGVNVQFITWDFAYKHGKKLLGGLKKVLGTDIRAASYLKICKGSCYNTGGTHHAKMLLISRVVGTGKRSTKYVSFVTSANISTGSVKKSWNHAELVTERPKIYGALKTYFDGMKYDRTKRNFKSVSDGPFRLYFFPSTKLVNPFYQSLQATSCKASGDKKTVIRVMMYLWTYRLRNIAQRLVQLKKQGCNVAVVVSVGPTDPRILKVLKKGHVATYDARTKSRFVHAKMGVIDGRIGGKSTHLVMTGSLNFTGNSILNNTEIALFVNDDASAQQALSVFTRMSRYSHKV